MKDDALLLALASINDYTPKERERIAQLAAERIRQLHQAKGPLKKIGKVIELDHAEKDI